MTTKEILTAAKAILTAKGRTTTTLCDPKTGKCCALGAIVIAEGWTHDASANRDSQHAGYVMAERSLAVPVLNAAISRYLEMNPERFGRMWSIWLNDPIPVDRVYGFNDDTRRIDDADVLNVFDIAIEMADAV